MSSFVRLPQFLRKEGDASEERAMRGLCQAAPRLAWSGDRGDYEGMTVALLVVVAIAAVCWLVGHKGWGIGWKLVFWVALLVALWVLVAVGGVPQPSG